MATLVQDITWQDNLVTRTARSAATGRGATIWLTGLSGSGKSTIAMLLEQRLIEMGRAAYVLDGDNLRHGLNSDLGFSPEDRTENVRRAAHTARLFADAGVVAVVSLISPYQSDRDSARDAHASVGIPFLEVFVDTPIEECERRDIKGLYAKARAGQIRGFTGVDAPYERPLAADVVIETLRLSEADSVELILDALRAAM